MYTRVSLEGHELQGEVAHARLASPCGTAIIHHCREACDISQEGCGRPTYGALEMVHNVINACLLRHQEVQA